MTTNERHEHDLQALGDGVYLDVQKLIDSRLLVQANSGGGKSYVVRKICEVAFGHAQIIILDPDGEFHTLREKFDFALAGPEGEAPATVESAAQLAKTLLELGTSCVIDIYELGGKRAAFIARFVEALMRAPRDLWHDLILVVDEASKFCTEGGKRDKATEESSNAIIDLMTRGRKRGFAGVLATQRLADLSKSAAAECNTTLIGRCNLDVDIDRAAKRLGMKPVQANEVLPELAAGQFFAMGPAIINDWSPHRVAKIKVGTVTTTHPKRGQKVPVTPPRATVKKVLGKLKAIPVDAAAEAKTIEELRALVETLQADLASASKGRPSHETADLRTALEVTTNSRNVNAKKLDETKAQWEQMKRERDHVIKERDDAKAKAYTLTQLMARYTGIVQKLRGIADDIDAAKPATPAAMFPPGSGGKEHSPFDPPSTRTYGRNPTSTAQVASDVRANGATQTPTSAHQRVLDIVALLERLGIEPATNTIAVWYGQHPKSRGFRNYLSTLRTEGYLDEHRHLTDRGKARAQVIDMPTQEAVFERIMAPLDAPTRRVFQLIIDYGNLTRDELADHLGCHPETRSYRNLVSKLRTRGLVTDGWPIQPAPVLFVPTGSA